MMVGLRERASVSVRTCVCVCLYVSSDSDMMSPVHIARKGVCACVRANVSERMCVRMSLPTVVELLRHRHPFLSCTCTTTTITTSSSSSSAHSSPSPCPVPGFVPPTPVSAGCHLIQDQPKNKSVPSAQIMW